MKLESIQKSIKKLETDMSKLWKNCTKNIIEIIIIYGKWESKV